MKKNYRVEFILEELLLLGKISSVEYRKLMKLKAKSSSLFDELFSKNELDSDSFDKEKFIKSLLKNYTAIGKEDVEGEKLKASLHFKKGNYSKALNILNNYEKSNLSEKEFLFRKAYILLCKEKEKEIDTMISEKKYLLALSELEGLKKTVSQCERINNKYIETKNTFCIIGKISICLLLFFILLGFINYFTVTLINIDLNPLFLIGISGIILIFMTIILKIFLNKKYITGEVLTTINFNIILGILLILMWVSNINYIRENLFILWILFKFFIYVFLLVDNAKTLKSISKIVIRFIFFGILFIIDIFYFEISFIPNIVIFLWIFILFLIVLFFNELQRYWFCSNCCGGFNQEYDICPYCSFPIKRILIKERAKKIKELFFDFSLKDFVLVKAGTFIMGAPSSEIEEILNEYDYNYENIERQHKVRISRDYYIAKYPVTYEQWKAVMGYNPTQFKDDNLPVNNVNWNDAQEFIKRLNQITGKNFRLPTEAEWEYAARGGQKSKGYKYSGSNNIDEVTWYEQNSNGQRQPVGSKKPNELGIYDMSGNVWEWCLDFYDEYPKRKVSDPKGPIKGTKNVIRGGAWYTPSVFCRVSQRYYASPAVDKKLGYGFRLVYSL